MEDDVPDGGVWMDGRLAAEFEGRTAVQRFDQVIGDFFGAIESVRVDSRAFEQAPEISNP